MRDDRRRRWLLGAAASLLAAPRLQAASRAPDAASVEVTLHIDMRAAIAAGSFDPTRQRVGLRGSVAPLDWGRTLLAPAGPAPGRYTLRFEIARAAAGGQPVAYKFKIEWADGGVAADPGAGGATLANGGWEEGRNRSFMLPADATLELQRAWGEAGDLPPPQRTGHIDVHMLPGPGGGAARKLQVWLPPGFRTEAGAPALPLLLMLDGDNVFDALAAGAEWQLDEHAQVGVQSGALRPFVVAAVSQGASRVNDYTPWPGTGPHSGSGGGLPGYADWLGDVVLPFVRRHHACADTAADTAIGGSSLGGLAAMWMLAERPHRFGAGLVASPSVWWAGERIVETVRHARWAAPPRVWLCVGGREGPGMVAGARRLREALSARGAATAYTEDAEAGHTETAWAARVPAMLRFLHRR